MKKKIILMGLVVLSVFILTGCNKKNNEDALKFKTDYEEVNGKKNKVGKENRTVNIPDDNPYVYISGKDLLEKINNKESFYIYFGSPLCPWCRSAVEKSIEVANKNKINKIYYLDIWNKDGEEIFRDKYILNDNNELEKINEGTSEYKEIINIFKNVLSDYVLEDKDGNKVSVGEKRIFAPNFIKVEKGKAIKLVEGTSSKQKDSREKLTKELLDDEEKIFNEFFK